MKEILDIFRLGSTFFKTVSVFLCSVWFSESGCSSWAWPGFLERQAVHMPFLPALRAIAVLQETLLTRQVWIAPTGLCGPHGESLVRASIGLPHFQKVKLVIVSPQLEAVLKVSI